MPLEEIVPTCYACGTPMVLREKNDSKFWGCPNWRECKGKTIPFGKPRPKDKPDVIKPEQPDPMLLVIEELQAFRGEFNKRFDDLGKYLSEKLK